MFRTCIDNYSKTVHFIASCTDPQKVIESLQSRLISIKIPHLENIHLEKIAKKIVNSEGIKITNDALKHMILVSHGSARSLINYLQKFHHQLKYRHQYILNSIDYEPTS
jgi:DNA polymerase III delta prime subunit